MDWGKPTGTGDMTEAAGLASERVLKRCGFQESARNTTTWRKR